MKESACKLVLFADRLTTISEDVRAVQEQSSDIGDDRLTPIPSYKFYFPTVGVFKFWWQSSSLLAKTRIIRSFTPKKTYSMIHKDKKCLFPTFFYHMGLKTTLC